jgi:uncharacterized protein Veg
VRDHQVDLGDGIKKKKKNGRKKEKQKKVELPNL